MNLTSPEYTYLTTLLADNAHVQLCAIRQTDKSKSHSGSERSKNQWFTDPDELLTKAREWSGENWLLCTSMNTPLSLPDDWLTDLLVVKHTRLLIDFDRKESHGRNATEAEIQSAFTLAQEFIEDTQFWMGKPSVMMSGNGVHLIYKVDIKTSATTHSALKRMYTEFSERYQNGITKLDSTTYNPARLCRFYGTINRKFPDHPDYPQRVSKVVNLTTEISGLTVDEITRRYPEPVRPVLKVIRGGKSAGFVDWKKLDITRWFNDRGLLGKSLGGGKHAALCPWEQQGAHDKSCSSDTVIWEMGDKGFPTFNCSHDTCRERGSLMDLNKMIGGIGDYCK